MTKPVIVLAHGAGAPSSSAWMRAWRRRLGALGTVTTFDYPYMRAGSRRPDRLELLITAHRNALERTRRRYGNCVVLAGKSMGGRIGCHVALEEPVRALVCLGYPLVSPTGAVRDEVLMALTAPILFVQGTRDGLCPLERLEQIRKKMAAPSQLHVVESGDHSLVATKSWLRQHSATQRAVDGRVTRAIADFLREHVIG